jgi:hypothetical protein
VTDAELRDAAVAALAQTTVSGVEYRKRLAAGAYPNPLLTKWGQALNLLSKIDVPVPPPAGAAQPVGPFTVKDGAGSTVSYPDCFVRTATTTTIRQKHVKNVTGYGVGSMQFWPPTVEDTGYTTLEDCIATDVHQAQPGKMGGTGEACFWIGNRTNAKRLYAARAGWMGAFVGARCHDSVIEDFTVEQCPVGVYVEHVAHDVTFRRLFTRDIRDQPVAGGSEPGGVLAARSVSVEWWYGGQGSYNLTLENCDIYCPAGNDPRCGVYVGPGTYGMRFLGCRFWGPGVGVRLPTVRVAGKPDAVFDACVFENAGQRVVYHSLPMG